MCQGALEAFVMIDSSTSVEDTSYTLAQGFVKNFMSKFVMGSNLMRMGVIQFTEDINVLSNLNGNPTKVAQAIDSPRDRGNTDITGALNKAAELVCIIYNI